MPVSTGESVTFLACSEENEAIPREAGRLCGMYHGEPCWLPRFYALPEPPAAKIAGFLLMDESTFIVHPM
ncbi:hypothetical protein [Polystyrenella longa]|uniref:hypothetical protein n=1 Tax=Polystyrenella longa TaxID=2528007 RepID=UPI0011A2F3E3|nr:hypothetical protein [Polystyrenella longa]